MMMKFFAIFVAALTAENLFFTRAFDVYGLRALHRSPKKMLLFGGLTTAVLAVAGPVAYGINKLIYGLPFYYYINGIAHLLILVGLYAGVYWLLKKYQPKAFELVGKYLPYAAINCCTFGSLLLAAKDTELDRWWKALAYHCGAGIGFTLAMLLLWSVRQRLSSCHASKSFRGLPLQMITVGLIALALVGLTGNQLPA